MKTIESIKNFLIFRDLDIKELQQVLSCLEAREKTYKKGDIIYHYMDKIDHLGIVFTGIVRASTFNSNGTEHNVRFFKVGDTFGESFACVPNKRIMLEVTAQNDCIVIFLKLSKLMDKTAERCPCAAQITVNLLKIIAEKNVFQVKKAQIINQKKIRDKLKLFLADFKDENNIIVIPFNRQELANYLGIERSALSREMGKMKSENIIEFHKNTITILNESIFNI